MKVFDCITYYDEPLLFEIRLNVLDNFVDEFIVSEALFSHSGEKKKINFNINNYPKFKNRIKHIIIEDEPDNLIEITTQNKSNNSFFRLNASRRIEHQRNKTFGHNTRRYPGHIVPVPLDSLTFHQLMACQNYEPQRKTIGEVFEQSSEENRK